MDVESSAHGWVHSALAETCPSTDALQTSNCELVYLESLGASRL